MKKVVLVTGSNKGIGFEVVRQLTQRGHTVYLAARDVARGEAAIHQLSLENLSVRLVPLDVTQDHSISQAANYVKQHSGKMDVLINNAAILLKEDRSLTSDPNEVFQRTWLTNVTGVLNVTRQFLPLISRGGRIINTSSGGGSMTDPVGGWSPAYCVSKSAVNALTRQLAFELGSKQITVCAYCPGWVKTDMGGKSAPRGVAQGADTAVWLSETPTVKTGTFYRDRQEIPW